jgi:hypothetical protein
VRKEGSGGRLECCFCGQKNTHTAQFLLRHISKSSEYVFGFLLGLVPTSGEELSSQVVYMGLWLCEGDIHCLSSISPLPLNQKKGAERSVGQRTSTHAPKTTLLHQNKKCEKKHWTDGLNASSSDKRERTLAQGLVALNQLTHTIFLGFFGLWTGLGPVAGKLGVGVYIWVCGCFWGDRRIWEEVRYAFHFCLVLVDIGKLELLSAVVAGIGVCLS